MRRRAWCTAVAVGFLLGVVHPVTGQTTTAVVTVGTDETVPGDQGSVPVTLSSGLDRMTTVSGDLLFVADVLTLRTCVIGSGIGSGTPSDKGLGYNLVAPGRIRFIIFGLNQNTIPDGLLFSCDFDVAVGAAPGTTMLQLDMFVASDANAMEVPTMVEPGGITITRCGDVNGDGAVDIGDALIVAQYDVQVRQCGVAPFSHPVACDVSPFAGSCDIGDALRIAQCDVGAISCDFRCHRFTCP